MRNVTEKIKTLILLILAVSMIALWVRYISVQFDRTEKSESNENRLESDFWVYTGAPVVSSSNNINTNYFSPASVSLILSESKYSSTNNEELTKSLWENCKPLVNEVFSSNYTCSQATLSDWKKALEVKDGILVEFFSPLPYTIIGLFSRNSYSYCSGQLCTVDKLLLYSDSSNVLAAISTDGNGNVHVYTHSNPDTPATLYDFNSNNLAAYTVNEGLIEFDFNNNLNEEKRFENLSSDTKLLNTPISLPTLTMQNPFGNTLDTAAGNSTLSYLELVNIPEINRILEAFDVNPNIVGYYSDDKYGLIFVGQDMRLAIQPSGEIIYSVNDEAPIQITTSALLNSATVEFSANEIISCATAFLDRFDKNLIGGNATPIIRNVSYSSKYDLFEVSLDYCFELTDVTINGYSPAITLTFTPDGLKEARIFPASIHTTEAEAPTEHLSSEVLPFVAAHMSGDSEGSLKLIYSFSEYGDLSQALWIKEDRK